MADGPQDPFAVELPAGGALHLMSLEEVEMWENATHRYRDDYALQKTNDLVLLGAILTQQLALFRAQQRINGMEAELDADNVPTGKYTKTKLKASEMSAAQGVVIKASTEIRELEKTLGIDKKTRDSGGQQTTADYLGKLKGAAREMGIHISKRTLAYEEFAMASRTKLRMLANADSEDLQYEGLTTEVYMEWQRGELAKLEEIDKDFAKEKAKLWVGQL